MEQLLIDLRLAARLLVKGPGFTTVAVAFARPRDRRQHDDLQSLERVAPSAIARARAGAPRHRLHQRLQRAPLRRLGLSRLSGVPVREPGVRGPRGLRHKPLLFTEGGESRRILAQLVTGNFFDVLGLQASYGRTVLKDEETAGQHPVVVLSEPFWRSRFAGDPERRGPRGGAQREALHRRRHRARRLPRPRPRHRHGRVRAARHASGALRRLDPGARQPQPDDDRPPAGGAGLEEARAELRVVARRLHASYPEEWTDRRGEPRSVSVLPERRVPGAAHGARADLRLPRRAVRGRRTRAADRLLERGEPAARAREREAARDRGPVALGAGRARLVRQLLTESLLLSVVAGRARAGPRRRGAEGDPGAPAAAALLARAGAAARPARAFFALLLSLATGVAFGLLPALRASGTARWKRSRPGAAQPPRGAAARAARRPRGRSGGGLAGAARRRRALPAEPLARAGDRPRLRSGASGRLLARPRRAGLRRRAGRGFYAALQERLAATPGRDGASFSTYLPLTLGGERRGFRAVGYTPGPGEDMEVASSFVGADYFETMRTALVRGRGFTPQDAPGTRPVVVVNEAFVRRFWPGRDGLGERLVLPWHGGEVDDGGGRDRARRQVRLARRVADTLHLLSAPPALSVADGGGRAHAG